MSGNANHATPFHGSRPPGFPAIGSSLKVTLQSGHADVAGLAVGMEPAPPPSSSFSTAHHPFYPSTPTTSKTQLLPLLRQVGLQGWVPRYISFPAASPQPAVQVPVTSARSTACPPSIPRRPN
ncbi:hypothetical protein Q5P01_024475 [Channa striata]|uniref:Uncharacterized protein n=1 Tax=Channa striata TaxID=64152 RepID=A0AA88ITS8_CHASR|nr:hypothetical protein Q5P01_024475 [Channa striata]